MYIEKNKKSLLYLLHFLAAHKKKALKRLIYKIWSRGNVLTRITKIDQREKTKGRKVAAKALPPDLEWNRTELNLEKRIGGEDLEMTHIRTRIHPHPPTIMPYTHTYTYFLLSPINTNS